MAIALAAVEEPVFPVVRCSTCPSTDKWKKMLSRRTSEVPNEDGGYLWEYNCMRCVMQKHGFETEGEARHFMYE